MKPERWQQVKEVFNEAFETSSEERAAFLSEAVTDEETRRDVESLLDFFENNFPGKNDCEIAVGHKLRQYEIREKIGAGGMGEVYLAEDTRLNRPVAIKFLLLDADSGAKSEKRLFREAQSIAALDHPNICHIYEVGEANGRFFIVMQYVEGETLETRIKRGRLPVDESLHFALNIADALTEAHLRGIIHRDIKPSNIIVGSRGRIKVLDFSLAKKVFAADNDKTQSLLSQSGMIAGTVAYMSPEQARGRDIDARSDIWSLGVVLYEMLTGHLPFAGETKNDIIASVLQKEFAPIADYFENLPDDFGDVIGKALEKKRDRRFQTLEDFTAELRRLQSLLDSQSEIKIAAKSAVREKFLISEHQEKQASKLLSEERFAIVKPTASQINLATDESEAHPSVKFAAAAKEKFFGTAAFAVLLIILSATVWQAVRWSQAKTLPFSADSRSNLQISTLFDTKLKSGGSADNLSFSPDGNLLAFSLYGDGKSSIFIKQIGGGEPLRITDGKWFDTSPIWSPDGQRIAFLSNRDGRKQVWTISFLGGNPVLLKMFEFPQFATLKKWSRDGRALYYEADNELCALNLESGQSAQIISDPKLSGFNISPNEELIAYVTTEDEKEQIWIQPLRGGEAKQVTRGSNHHLLPAWFPDNRHIAYGSDQNGDYQIYVSDTQNGETSQITFGDFGAESPIVSPDGSKIAFALEKNEANIYSFDFQNGKEIAQTANTGMQLSPAVSPASQQIAFESMPQQSKIFDSLIKLKSLDAGSEPLTITENGGAAKWSPDGKSVAFLRRVSDKLRLWKIDSNGQAEKQLTTDDVMVGGFTPIPFELIGTYFSWSPDGKQIAYCSKKNGSQNIWTISSDGLNEEKRTNNTDSGLIIRTPLWSPEGNRFAYLATTTSPTADEKFRNSIRLDSNGQTKTIFETNSQMSLLRWSASGDEIFVAVKDAANIILYRLSANSDRKPNQIAKFPDAYLHSVKISADEKQIAFTARRGGNDNVYIISAKNGESRQLTANFDSTLYYSGLNWSPDGKMLYYSKQTGGLQISMISNPK